MRWLRPTLNSIYGMLGHAPSPPTGQIAERLEEVRQAMLTELASAGEGEQQRLVTHRIRYAGDLQTLWYCRSDIMNVLAEAHGEAVAHEKVRLLSGLFEGLLPEATNYRKSRRPR